VRPRLPKSAFALLPKKFRKSGPKAQPWTVVGTTRRDSYSLGWRFESSRGHHRDQARDGPEGPSLAAFPTPMYQSRRASARANQQRLPEPAARRMEGAASPRPAAESLESTLHEL